MRRELADAADLYPDVAVCGGDPSGDDTDAPDDGDTGEDDTDDGSFVPESGAYRVEVQRVIEDTCPFGAFEPYVAQVTVTATEMRIASGDRDPVTCPLTGYTFDCGGTTHTDVEDAFVMEQDVFQAGTWTSATRFTLDERVMVFCDGHGCPEGVTSCGWEVEAEAVRE